MSQPGWSAGCSATSCGTSGTWCLLVAHRRSTLWLADRVIVLDGGRVADSGTHEDLVARGAVHRTLLSDVDDDVTVGDRIEALVAMTSGGVTASAWAREQRTGSPAATRTIGPPSIGPGSGGSGGGWRLNLAPTPEPLAGVAALPPVRDVAAVDLARESRHQRRFSLVGLLREFRRPLLAGLILVIVDALAGRVDRLRPPVSLLGCPRGRPLWGDLGWWDGEVL